MERINYGCWLGSWVIGTDNNVWIAQNVSDLGCRKSSKICWQEPSLKLRIFTTLADILPIVWSSYKCIWRGSLSRDLMNTPDCWYIWRGVAVVAKEKDNTKICLLCSPILSGGAPRTSVRKGPLEHGEKWNIFGNIQAFRDTTYQFSTTYILFSFFWAMTQECSGPKRCWGCRSLEGLSVWTLGSVPALETTATKIIIWNRTSWSRYHQTSPYPFD